MDKSTEYSCWETHWDNSLALLGYSLSANIQVRIGVMLKKLIFWSFKWTYFQVWQGFPSAAEIKNKKSSVNSFSDFISSWVWAVLLKYRPLGPAGTFEQINCDSSSIDGYRDSQVHRCCMCVIMSSGLLAVGNNDFREVCNSVTARLLLWSIPFPGLRWHTH